MENEIDLGEIIILLLKGKRIIFAVVAVFIVLAVLYSFYLAPPPYETAVIIDPSPYIHEIEDFPYNREIEDVLTKALYSMVIPEALQELDGGSLTLADDVTVEHIEDTGLLIIRAVHRDLDFSREIAARSGLAVLEAERDDRTYRLSVRKESCEQALAELDRYVEANFDEKGQQVYLSWSTGDLTGLVLELEPAYKSVLLEKGRLIVELQVVANELNRLETDPQLEPSQWFYFGEVNLEGPGRAVTIVLAAILGLFLSASGILLYNYLVTTGLAARKKDGAKAS